jgi:hypothetical protein
MVCIRGVRNGSVGGSFLKEGVFSPLHTILEERRCTSATNEKMALELLAYSSYKLKYKSGVLLF